MTPETFTEHFRSLVRQSEQTRKRFALSWDARMPMLREDTATTAFDRHYIYHTAWAARAVRQIAPRKHVDFSSSLYFCALVSAFVEVEFCDIRPPELELPGLSKRSENLTSLSFEEGSLASASCMHVLEHVGLARYGDPLDYDGDLKAMSELARVMAPGGDLLLAVPVGAAATIHFNAHRVYRFSDVPEIFSRSFDVIEQALIPEKGPAGMIPWPSADRLTGETYGCGCYWLRKRL
jgi:SAM-dependent methyltransferase